jgi:predicted nucleic acid-binding Zn ribbon protein
MDCPNCGVYNPQGRQVCWRCDQELPKPVEPKKRTRDPDQARRRMWIIIGIILLIWIVLTWVVLPLLSGNLAPAP